MHHLAKIPPVAPEGELWSRYAARDLDVVIHYLHQAAKQRRCGAGYTASILRALICYSKPFTERANPVVNQYPRERECFLSLAADLGADLRLHALVLQARDAVVALSDLAPAPSAHSSIRRFKHPDARLARIIRTLELGCFRTLVVRMRVACNFIEAEMDIRRL
jgi:hypothetical protein